jgi:glycosyltransferase involved in cell wall biosynthesis
VAICTRNRADLAAQAVASVVAQNCAPDQLEVLLIDSGSDQPQRQTLEALAASEPRVTLLRIEESGLSRARNLALEKAQADIVAYLDDDAIAEGGWAAAIVAAFRTASPRPSVVGGPIRPMFAAPKPTWWPEAYLRLLTISEENSTGFVDPDTSSIFGANVAYDKRAVLSIGGFPMHLGRDGSSLVSGEEAWVNYELQARGAKFFYMVDAAVCHLVPADRLTQAWLKKRLYWEAVSQACLMQRFFADKVPTKLAKEAVKLVLLMPFGAPGIRWNGAAAVLNAGRLSYARGYLWAFMSGYARHAAFTATEARTDA